MNNKTMIPITFEQAFYCLYITINSKVRCIVTSGFYFGMDMDLNRAEEILKTAESSYKLFLSDTLGGELYHDIFAWDPESQKWVYFECIPEKVETLKKKLNLKAS